MNKGKREAHYRILDTAILLLSAVRYPYQTPYKQLESFACGLHRLVPELTGRLQQLFSEHAMGRRLGSISLER